MPIASGVAVLLVIVILRPTVLVVNEDGFGVRARRLQNRLAVPWSDVADVGRGEQDSVLITPTPGPDGESRPRLELRGAGAAGAEQIIALLCSYLAAHRQA